MCPKTLKMIKKHKFYFKEIAHVIFSNDKRQFIGDLLIYQQCLIIDLCFSIY